jgi:hypothetical protein
MTQSARKLNTIKIRISVNFKACSIHNYCSADEIRYVANDIALWYPRVDGVEFSILVLVWDLKCSVRKIRFQECLLRVWEGMFEFTK